MVRKVLLCAALLALAASICFGYSDADKVFSVSHNDLGANGSVISTWGLFTKTGATGFDPTVQTLTDPVTSQSVKWGKPAAGTLDGSGNTTAGGSGFNSGIIDGIVNTGFTIVTAIIPSTNALGSSDYRSIVNAYLGGLGLYQMDNGKVCLRLEKTYNTYNTFTTGTGILTDGTRTVLSLVVSNTGVYELWRDVITGGVTVSTEILSGTSSSWPSGDLLPSVTPTGSTPTSRNSIGLGSAGGNNTGTTASTFRGYIGDTYLYKTALTSQERIALVASVETSMNMIAGGTQYTITASAGTGGTITPSGAVLVNQGANQTFTIAANTGYQISQVAVDSVNQGAITSYTFNNVQANHTISATFTPITYTITASAGSNGTITPSGAVVVNYGANQSFTIAANTGYQISQVTVDSVGQGPITSYTFNNVTANHTISATFSVLTHTITASAGSNGTITPSGAVVVNHGANQSFTIAANSGYSITDVVVDSVSQGPITSYTFTNVITNHTISATFGGSTYTITASAGTGGTITPSGAVVVNSGANQGFTIAANSGYLISQVSVDGVNRGAISGYTFTNVTANHTIAATFVASPTPTAFFQFENNVNDTQGAFNGTAYGTPTYITGKVGSYAIQFDGLTQYVSITRPVSTDFTIAFFVKTTQISGTGTQWYNGKGLVDCEVAGTGNNDFGVAYVNSKLDFGVGNPDTTFESASTINGGTWKHVACTRNGTTGEMKIYINGTLETTGTGPTGARNAATYMHFGKRQSGSKFFAGSIRPTKDLQ